MVDINPENSAMYNAHAFFNETDTDAKRQNDFFQYVAQGDLFSVKQCLHFNPSLPKIKGCLHDNAGREFTGITALQYAHWAKDIYMCELIASYLEPIEALEQINQQKEITNKSGHGDEYDTELLINAYANFHKQFAENTYDYSKIAPTWDQVGKIQATLPKHFANEYRKARGFDPIPFFTGKYTEENTSMKWLPISKDGTWQTTPYTAIVRADQPETTQLSYINFYFINLGIKTGTSKHSYYDQTILDSGAMKRLFYCRESQLNGFKKILRLEQQYKQMLK